jgi:glycosyltransferase involved in cell wall biosynthesis
MLVGVDATCWRNTRGYGRHARGLLSALVRTDQGNRYVFLIDSEDQFQALPSEAEVRLVRNAMPTAVATSANGRRSVADMWKMSRALSRREFDIVLFPTVYSYVPILSRAKKVVMIHDVIAETYPDLTVPKRPARLFWNAKVALGRWQADAIVTVSDYSRKGIVDYFGVSPQRVFVVGEANDPIFQVLEDPQPGDRLGALGISRCARSVVYVGGFGPHKNLERLIDAFAALASRREFADLKLIMVGEYEKEVFHSSFKSIKSRVQELGLSDRVIFTGYLADEDLVTLLNLSTVLALPSLMEGFGLPAIEAAACGCPVIATKASPLPSLLRDGALYIDPNDQQELEHSLERVLISSELRQQLKVAGLVAAQRLTWNAAAAELLAVFNRLQVS